MLKEIPSSTWAHTQISAKNKYSITKLLSAHSPRLTGPIFFRAQQAHIFLMYLSITYQNLQHYKSLQSIYV